MAQPREKALKSFAGIVIGLSLTLIHIVGIPITGTSVNPGLSLGPALISGIVGGQAGLIVINQLWLFWGSPNHRRTLGCSRLATSRMNRQLLLNLPFFLVGILIFS